MNNVTVEWVVRNCHPLTDIQRHMTDWHFRNGSLVGVARAVGRGVYFPMVQRGKAPPSIIDAAGYEQLCTPMSGKCPNAKS